MYSPSQNMIAALGAQYAHETANSLRYFQRAIYAESIGLTGVAAFFRKQAADERSHADKVFQFAIDRSVIIPLSGFSFSDMDIPAGTEMQSLFYSALEIEAETTAALEGLLEFARDEKDHMTEQWLLTPGGLIEEQREEECLYKTIIDRITQIGGPTIAHDIDMWIVQTM